MEGETAFLNRDLEKDEFMEQPKGFTDNIKQSHVCKLQNALYGLKHVPRHWVPEIYSSFGDKSKFQSVLFAPSFHVKQTKTEMTLIALYVDNLLMAGKSLKDIYANKDQVFKRFEM